MRFWDWALEAYARPGVAEACLELQDSHRQSVPYLLWAAWAASEGRPLSAPLLAQGAALASHWDAAAVQPLRVARRALKAGVEGVPDAEREALRAEIKALELRAEGVVIGALEALTPAPSGPRQPLAPDLTAAADAWAFAAPVEMLARLAQAVD